MFVSSIPITALGNEGETLQDVPGESGNSSRSTVFDSDGDGFTDDIDISPFGDLHLNVTVTYYSQDTIDAIDSFDDSDPYFIIEADTDGDEILDFEYETPYYYENVDVVYYPFEYEINIDDDIPLTQFLIWVYDLDTLSADDILDYTPVDGTGFRHTLLTDDLETTYSYDYNGEDDGYIGEMDCRIKYEAKFVIKETVIHLGEYDNWDEMDYYYSFEFPEIVPGDQIRFEAEIMNADADQVSIYFMDKANFEAFERNDDCYYNTNLSSFDNSNGIVVIENEYELDIPEITAPSAFTHDLRPSIEWESVMATKEDYVFLVFNWGIDGNGVNDQVDVVIRPVLERGTGTENVKYTLNVEDLTSGVVVEDTETSINGLQLTDDLEYGHEYRVTVTADNSGSTTVSQMVFHAWNEAPTIEDLSIYKHEKTVYAYEPVILFADIIDYDGDPFDVSIDYGDGTMVNDTLVDLHVFSDPGSYQITVTASDNWEESVETLEITVLDFPVDLYKDEIELSKGTQTVEFSSNYTTTLTSKVMSPWTSVLPWPFDTLKMAFSFEVEVKVIHTGHVKFEQKVEQDEGSSTIDTVLKSSHDEYEFTMLPYFKVHWQLGEKYGYILLPIPTLFEIYDGQPSITLFGKTIYFWTEHTPVGEKEMFENSIGEELEIERLLEIAEIDLLEFLEDLVTGYFGGPVGGTVWEMAKSLGHTFLGLFGFDIEPVLNLTFNIKLTSIIWESAGLVSMSEGKMVAPEDCADEEGCLADYDISDSEEFEIEGFEDKENIWSSYNIMSHWIDIEISGSVGLLIGWIEIKDPWWCWNCTPERIEHLVYIEIFDTASIGLLMGASTFETHFGSTYTIFKNIDTDGDGTFDPVDEDDDGDGYNDTVEFLEKTDSLDSTSIPVDNDKDFLPDTTDPDDDGDGYNDSIEVSEGTDPMNATSTPKDADGDFIPNSMDPDFKKKEPHGGLLGDNHSGIMVVMCVIVISIWRANRKR